MKTLKSIFMLIAVTVAMAACATSTKAGAPYTQATAFDTLSIPTKNVPDGPLKCIVIRPQQYTVAADTTHYPVVYLLNGYSGNHTSWPTVRPDLDSLATVYGMIFVCPDGRNSWYWDAPKVPAMKMETMITTELIPFIDSHYRTIADRTGRAVTGLSMGGQGAMWLSIRHPELFGSSGSTSGGVDIRPFPTKWQMAQWLGPEAENQQLWDEHSIVNLVKDIKPGQINLIIDCGSDDFFAEVNNNLHKLLLENKIPHDYISRPGIHNRPYWNNSILYQLQYFNQCFKRR
jgi:S-formylglutathione hydrolase FrmB